MASIFGQSEKLSEIKPPLVITKSSLKPNLLCQAKTIYIVSFLVRFFDFLLYRRRCSIVEKKNESQFSFMTLFKTVNQSVIDGVKCVGKKRPHRHLLLFSIFLMVFTGMNHSGNTQLYVEKVFGWTLPEYTNYIRFVNFFHYILETRQPKTRKNRERKF